MCFDYFSVPDKHSKTNVGGGMYGTGGPTVVIGDDLAALGTIDIRAIKIMAAVGISTRASLSE